MGASSVTGVSGPGVSGKATTNELSQWANGPSILIADIVSADGNIGISPPSSPPAAGATVVFAKPLEGTSDNFIVILTPIGGTGAFVGNLLDDDLDGDSIDDHFIGFTINAESDCDVMYIVLKKGQRVI